EKFAVERSYNGKSFETIGVVLGQGNSSQSTKYSFRDKTVANTSAVYYRLKQVDFDGTFEYSKVISVSMNSSAAQAEVQAYPNPFANELHVAITATESGTAELLLVNLQGAAVYSRSLTLKTGLTAVELPVEQLNSGIYILKVKGAGIDATTKLVKLR
ncbi:MAG: T9SS type A sorting domain-containing protein, partial [Hymenobacteraceae bacterium]|nr:T9SS type A sorting domain-containing protein [Hymenobacteraceae bacterium]